MAISCRLGQEGRRLARLAVVRGVGKTRWRLTLQAGRILPVRSLIRSVNRVRCGLPETGRSSASSDRATMG